MSEDSFRELQLLTDYPLPDMRWTLALIAGRLLSTYGLGLTSNQSLLIDQQELCDWTAYLARYPDITANGTLTDAQAKLHFETIGQAQGRQCTKDFQLIGLESFKLRNSACSHAINFEEALSLQKRLAQDTQPEIESANRLRAVDIGAGTTGTRFLFKVVCESIHLRGYHWTTPCANKGGHNPLVSWWGYLIHCVQNAAHDTDSSGCESDEAVKKLDYELKQIVHEVQVLMDTPMDTIYAHYASYMKDALTLMTIRDPMEWAVKRRSEHPSEPLMCKPEVFALGHAHHPYDIMSCLKSTEFVHQAIKIEKNLTRVAEGYVAMNTYNAALASHLHIMCLWDAPPEETEAEVIAAWEQFATSS